MSKINQPIHVAGISILTSNEEAFKNNTIGKLWDDFLKSSIKEQLHNSLLSDKTYAVYSNYESGYNGKYRITIGYSIDKAKKIPVELTTVMIPAGNYKIFPAKNQVADIISTWKTIWETDPKTLSPNFIVNFEEYSDADMKIYIGHE